MNKPATKLAAKGTLDTSAVSPSGAMMPMTLDMLVVTASKFMSKVPVYARAIMAKAMSPMVSAMPAALLTSFPAM